jgi:hypothetical protein
MKPTGNATAAPPPQRRNALIADEFVPVARTRNGCLNVNTPERHAT